MEEETIADDYETFIEGDSFLNEEEQEAQAARERRLKRKRRLEAVALVDKKDELNHITSKLKSTPSATVTRDDDNKLSQLTSEVGRSKEEDDFDMFSSSTSPPLSRDMLLRKQDTTKDPGNVDQQQDWDDAEGYYKATIGKKLLVIALI